MFGAAGHVHRGDADRHGAGTNKVVRGLWADVFLSITVSSMVIAFIVVEGIIHADPWYNAMQLVPISGMILGNTLAAGSGGHRPPVC